MNTLQLSPSAIAKLDALMRGCFVSPAIPIEIRMGTESQYRPYFPLNL